MKWLDRWVARLHEEPAPFACAWCIDDEARHDMCTGVALRPHMESLAPAAIATCLCALRDHDPPAPPPTPMQRFRNAIRPAPRR